MVDLKVDLKVELRRCSNSSRAPASLAGDLLPADDINTRSGPERDGALPATARALHALRTAARRLKEIRLPGVLHHVGQPASSHRAAPRPYSSSSKKCPSFPMASSSHSTALAGTFSIAHSRAAITDVTEVPQT